MFAYSDQLSSRTMQHVDDLRRDANHARVVCEARKHATTPARWRRFATRAPNPADDLGHANDVTCAVAA